MILDRLIQVADLLVVILDDVWMLELVKCVDFGDELLFFSLLHPSVVEFLPAENLPIRFLFYLEH